MKEIKIYGYCDESGNSGLNLFDSSQPFFWLGTLLSRYDLNECAASDINRLLQNVGENELHANKLGLTKIDLIAEDIIKILNKSNCYLVISKVEKRYIAKLKFFDYLFDSTNNKAVSPLHYGVRCLRLPLAKIVCDNMTLQMEKNFWKLYDNPNEQDIKDILYELKNNVIKNSMDKRANELIIDAINWAYEHPLAVFDTKKSLFDSPNIVAFSQLLIGINNLFKDEKVQIEKFYHDRQNQFGNSLQEMFKYIKDIRTDYRATDLITDLTLEDNFKCPLEIELDTSCGLQLVDVLLWLYKRNLEKPQQIQGNCRKLIRHMIPRTYIVEITAEAYLKTLIETNSEIMEMPFTQDDEKKGKMQLIALERQRKERMERST
ncbi:MAG TPA: DUF3800 domain-containing protein [Oscillospiraceae bacterium]|nr:DUF3800 domain-containing protein [Oscillospiraceae bacterium]